MVRSVVCLLLSLWPPLLLMLVLLPHSVASPERSGSHAIVATLLAPQRPVRVAMPLPAKPPVALPEGAKTDGAAGNDRGAYLPAAQLTERPRVLRDIVPEWTQPPIAQPIECVLLISEYGDIDRVLVDDVALTPAQQQAVRERLLAARFAPGRLYGRAVKTALRIEVWLR